MSVVRVGRFYLFLSPLPIPNNISGIRVINRIDIGVELKTMMMSHDNEIGVYCCAINMGLTWDGESQLLVGGKASTSKSLLVHVDYLISLFHVCVNYYNGHLSRVLIMCEAKLKMILIDG